MRLYRLLSSIVLIPIVIGAVILGGGWLFVVMGLGFLLCGYEYFTILRVGGYQPERTLGLILIAALMLDVLLDLNATRPILIASVALPLVWELRRRAHQNFLQNWALTTIGVLYIGGFGAHLFLLRGLRDGATLLGITLLATWATDIFAYVAGGAFGRRPFFAEISPKKTWEGALGGLAAGTVAFGGLASVYGIEPWLALAGGVGLVVAATLGDLLESLVKRQVGVKDSGSLCLGHGGVWDRLDSLLFTVTFAYYFFAYIISQPRS